MSPQPTHSTTHPKQFVTNSSCSCCNKSHPPQPPHVHTPHALSSCTQFCPDSPLQSQPPVSGSVELRSISGQGSDLAYRQQYLLQQYSAFEPKNKHSCHHNTAQHSNNKHSHQYISNNKFCTSYFYQLFYIYMHFICSCLSVCKQACVLCETKHTVTVGNSELPVYIYALHLFMSVCM
jgi:hypothetical protein